MMVLTGVKTRATRRRATSVTVVARDRQGLTRQSPYDPMLTMVTCR